MFLALTLDKNLVDFKISEHPNGIGEKNTKHQMQRCGRGHLFKSVPGAEAGASGHCRVKAGLWRGDGAFVSGQTRSSDLVKGNVGCVPQPPCHFTPHRQQSVLLRGQAFEEWV